MAATVESIEISRRPDDVFRYVLEPLYYREWDDSAVSAHREDPSPLAVGSKTTVLHRMGPWKVPTTEEVIEFTPPRQVTNRGVSGPLAGVARCTVEPLNGGWPSRLTIALEIEARGLGKLLLPFGRGRARWALPKQLKKLKEILDGGGVIADAGRSRALVRDPQADSGSERVGPGGGTGPRQPVRVRRGNGNAGAEPPRELRGVWLAKSFAVTSQSHFLR